ncbi:hydrogenase maturation protease [Ideonella oryzae]|uniref:Hydrogenase maturation protease n=1 Tax=Ideonella oryzae TaxID=2937441 RepID=A0ABT1BT55_9BURK|nr:hydrogenase maturation protease [Ideonella oryzae]
MDGLTPLPPSDPPAARLLLAWGNRSRGDDALGPLLLDRIQRWLAQQPAALRRAVECLEDQQLQIEHLLDLQGRQTVLFIDAAVGLQTPFSAMALTPCRDSSFTSHALSPQALLQAYRDVLGERPPPCQLLGLRASQFGLDSAPSPQALADLDAAEAWLRAWLQQATAW